MRRRNLVPPVSSGLAASFNARTPGAVTRNGSNVVSQWSDGSGNVRDLTVSGTAPVYNSSLINQRAGVDFSGGKRLVTAAFPLTAEVTVFAVAQWRTPATWGPIAHHGDRDTDWSLEQSGVDPGNVMHFQSEQRQRRRQARAHHEWQLCPHRQNHGADPVLLRHLDGWRNHHGGGLAGVHRPRQQDPLRRDVEHQ